MDVLGAGWSTLADSSVADAWVLGWHNHCAGMPLKYIGQCLRFLASSSPHISADKVWAQIRLSFYEAAHLQGYDPINPYPVLDSGM